MNDGDVQQLREMIEHMDQKLTPYTGSDEFTVAYLVPAGAWHQILAWARNTVPLAEALRAQIPNQQATTEAYRKAAEVSQADLNYEVRSLAGSRPTAPEPSEAAIAAGWKEFERITYSPLPKQQGGYTPSRGAFEFSLRAAYAVDALGGSPQPPAGDVPKITMQMLHAANEEHKLQVERFGCRPELIRPTVLRAAFVVWRAALRGGSKPEQRIDITTETIDRDTLERIKAWQAGIDLGSPQEPGKPQ